MYDTPLTWRPLNPTIESYISRVYLHNGFFSMQLQQLVDRTILQADKDGDGMISFEEFKDVRKNCDAGVYGFE